MRLRIMFSVALAGLVLMGSAPRSFAQSAAAIADLPPDLEIRLALSGLPEHLRENATAYVKGPDGYRIGQEGDNGFSCLVRRRGVTPAQFDRSMIIVCYDAEGSRTLLRSDLDQERLFSAGKSRAQVTAAIEEGWSSGRYEAPGKGVAYMLSPIMKVHNTDGTSFDYIPHLMMYAAGLSPEDIGMAMPPNPMGHLPFMTEPGEPYSMIVIPTAEADRKTIAANHAELIAAVQPFLE